jgi:hypothetical protein
VKELSQERLVGITRRKTVPAQVRQLRALGIRFGQRADKTLVVLEEEVQRVLTGQSKIPSTGAEPDWGAMP